MLAGRPGPEDLNGSPVRISRRDGSHRTLGGSAHSHGTHTLNRDTQAGIPKVFCQLKAFELKYL